MIEDIEYHVKSCPHCLRFKTQPENAEVNPIMATRPLELVHIDYLTVEAPANSKLRTTPYRPEGYGSCERFNWTLISILGTLAEDFKSKWPQHLCI